MRTPVLTTLLAILLVGCNGQAPAEGPAVDETPTPTETTTDVPEEDIGEVLATVNGIQIGSKEFQVAAARRTPADGDKLSLEEKQEILDELVVEKMLYLEAKAKGIDRDPKVQKVMINTLLRRDVYSNVRNSDFTQEELRAYFDAHRDEFVVPEKVQIKRIFIKVTDARPAEDARALATDLRGQVAADIDSFKELATRHSEDPYRRRGGDLGFVSREGKPGIDDAVVAKAFEMDVGQVSEVFEAGGGFNVVYVANRRERVERTFEQMKGSVLRKVKNEKYKQLYEEYVDSVRGDYAVDLDADTLATVEVEAGRRMSIGGRGPRGIDIRRPGESQPPGDGGREGADQ